MQRNLKEEVRKHSSTTCETEKLALFFVRCEYFESRANKSDLDLDCGKTEDLQKIPSFISNIGYRLILKKILGKR